MANLNKLLYTAINGNAVDFTLSNPILEKGTIGIEVDTGQAKIANGTSRWNDLAYLGQGSSITAPSAPLYPTIATITGTTHTLSASHHGSTIRYTAAGLVTVTIPTDATEDLADGFWVALHAEGAAGLTLSVVGLTIAPTSALKTIAQGEILVVMKTLTANTWMIIGGTVA